MTFRSVFIAVVIAFALILGAFLINRARPTGETEQPSAALVRATGKCAECHYGGNAQMAYECCSLHDAQRGGDRRCAASSRSVQRAKRTGSTAGLGHCSYEKLDVNGLA